MATAPTIEQSDMVQQFAEWVRTKPADETYDYSSCTNCALAQFLKASGMAVKPLVGPDRWSDREAKERVWHAIPVQIDAAAVEYPETFGALAERLSA